MIPHGIAMKLFELQVEANAIASIVTAIRDAMDSGSFSQDAYTPGLWLVSGLIEGHAEKLEALSDTVHPTASSKEGDAA